MLAKIFGTKSSGIVCLVSASVLVLTVCVSAIFCWLDNSYFPLIGIIVYAAVALALIAAPVFIQKKFKLYMPPALQFSVCVYSIVYTADLLVQTQAGEFLSFRSVVGGFCIAVAVFIIVYSLWAKFKANDAGKVKTAAAVTVITLGCCTVVLLLMNTVSYLVALAFYNSAAQLEHYMQMTLHYVSGAAAFSVVVFAVLILSGGNRRFLIRDFKDVERARTLAVKDKNKAFLKVIENIESDKTDYRVLYRQAKLKFFGARLGYLVLYAGYIIYAGISFSKMGTMGYVIICALVTSFIFLSITYIYEYRLYSKNALNQRLRWIKIVKCAVRIYTLALVLAAMFVAGLYYNELSAIISVVMVLVNLAMLFYNLFGKPKTYKSAERGK